MGKILTKKEKWAYAHWCMFPGMFWIISPWNWVALFLTCFSGYTLFPLFISVIKNLVLHLEWNYRALMFLSYTAYVLLCVAIGYGLVYLCVRLGYFFFDKDEFSQKHYKRYHICKNSLCVGCNDCEANAKR